MIKELCIGFDFVFWLRIYASLFSQQASFENQEDIQMMRFADYFGRAFSTVSASQFPWVKLFRESAVAKIADVSFKFIIFSFFSVDVNTA